MGCISSKLLFSAADLDHDIFFADDDGAAVVPGDCPNHFVSLTSTTYGVLDLDRAADDQPASEEEQSPASLPREEMKRDCKRSPPTIVIPTLSEKKTVPAGAAAKDEPSEVINAWELMGDLSDETPTRSPLKKPSKVQQLLLHISPAAARAAAAVTAVASPKKPMSSKFVGKENTPRRKQDSNKSDLEAGRVLRPYSSLENSQWGPLTPVVSVPKKIFAALSTGGVTKKTERDAGSSGSRRSLSPLFDPEFIASLEKAHCEEGEQIKTMVSVVPRDRSCRIAAQLLKLYEKKCPPSGENVVVLYTTTLRGIRRTYEDCNAVRSAINAYDVQIVERDISMDSGYREELRLLMGMKEVKVPMVFVKGRLIGGVEQVLKLDEEGKLGLLLEGIPSAEHWCEGCGSMRFVMCMDCNGSCKVLDEEQNKMVKCGHCNENGLIHCPICC